MHGRLCRIWFPPLMNTLKLSIVIGLLSMGSGCMGVNNVSKDEQTIIDLHKLADTQPEGRTRITLEQEKDLSDRKERDSEAKDSKPVNEPAGAAKSGAEGILGRVTGGRSTQDPPERSQPRFFESLDVPEAMFEDAPHALEQTPRIAPSTPWAISVNGGFGQMEGTRFGIGGVTKGGEEQALAKNSKRVNTTFIGAQVSYDLGPKWGFSATRLNVGGRYLWGEEKDSAEEQIGGSPVFISYDKQASPMSFTGAGLGTTGAVARSENHVKGTDLSLGWSGDYTFEGWPSEVWSTVSPNIAFKYKRLEQRGWGDVMSLIFGDAIRSETEQELDDHYYGIGTGFQLAKSCERSGMTVFMGGDITGYYRMTDLKSRQKNNCTTIGCTAANNHTARVTDTDSGFTYGVEGRAGVSLPLGQGVEVGGIGTVEYLDERGGIRNRENPNQDVKRIETDEALDWTAGLFVRKSF